MGFQADRTTLCRSQLYPPVRDLWIQLQYFIRLFCELPRVHNRTHVLQHIVFVSTEMSKCRFERAPCMSARPGQRQTTLQEISIYKFPEKELRGLSPNFGIHVSVSDLYIPSLVHLFSCSRIDRTIREYINGSQKHECRNWDSSRAVSFLRIFVSNFWYCVFALHDSTLSAYLEIHRPIETSYFLYDIYFKFGFFVRIWQLA
jgi:hypothetical protein